MCNLQFFQIKSKVKTINIIYLSFFFFSTQSFAEPKINDFYLIDADTGQFVMSLSNRADIILPIVPKKLSIQATANNETQSVKMYIGQVETSKENNEPYALKGDTLANGYNPVSELRTKGTISISAVPFSQDDASGEIGQKKTIWLSIIQPDFIVNRDQDISDSSAGNGKCATPISFKPFLPNNFNTVQSNSTPPITNFNMDGFIDAHYSPIDYFTNNSDCTLRAAIEEANALPGLQTILLPRPKYDYDNSDFIEDHVYKLTKNKQLMITDSIKIIGDGQPTIDGDDKTRIFLIHNPANKKIDVELNNLDMTQGYSHGNLNGGAILVKGNNINTVIKNSVIRDSRASNGGGIAIVRGASLSLLASKVSNNTGGFNIRSNGFSGGGVNQTGGGIFVVGKDTEVDIRRSYIYENHSGRGGGIMNVFGSVDIVNSIITENIALSTGGGIRNSGDLRITFSTIVNNKVSFMGRENRRRGLGGGLFMTKGKVSIGSSVIAENTDEHNSPDCYTSGNSVITGYRHTLIGVLNSECTFEDHVYHDHTGVDAGDSISPLVPGFSHASHFPSRYAPADLNSELIDKGERKFTIGYTFFSCPNYDIHSTARPQGRACDIGAIEYK